MYYVHVYPGLKPRQTLKALRRSIEYGRGWFIAAAYYLRELEEREGYRECGYASALDMIERELKLTAGAALELLCEARELPNLPSLVVHDSGR